MNRIPIGKEIARNECYIIRLENGYFGIADHSLDMVVATGTEKECWAFVSQKNSHSFYNVDDEKVCEELDDV